MNTWLHNQQPIRGEFPSEQKDTIYSFQCSHFLSISYLQFGLHGIFCVFRLQCSQELSSRLTIYEIDQDKTFVGEVWGWVTYKIQRQWCDDNFIKVKVLLSLCAFVQAYMRLGTCVIIGWFRAIVWKLFISPANQKLFCDKNISQLNCPKIWSYVDSIPLPHVIQFIGFCGTFTLLWLVKHICMYIYMIECSIAL